MLLLVLGAIVQATVVVFSGADVSGAVVGPGGPTPYELLLLGASGLLWALATIGVLAMWRYIRIGRAVDRARGVDPFAGPDTEPWPSEPTWKPDRAPIPPPAAGSDRAIAVVTVVLFLGATVGLQLLQTPLGPPAVPLFWGSMAASVPIALGIARGLSVVDAGVREIEHRYADVVRSGRG